jgi:uncharacterized coiled-coil protein SlyX
MDDQAVRLNRIEVKLDKLTEAMTMIARVDEKLVAGNQRIDRLEFRMDEQEADIDNLKGEVRSNNQTVKAVERLFWLAVSGGVGFIAYGMRL